MAKRLLVGLVVIGLVLGLARPNGRAAAEDQPDVPLYGVAEFSLEYPTGGLKDPYSMVKLSAIVTTPSGKQHSVGGFYAGPNRIKLRYLATEVGDYSLAVSVSGPSGPRETSFTFTSQPGKLPGLIRRHPENPYRLVDEKTNQLVNLQGFNNTWDIDPNNPHGGQLGNYIEDGVWKPLESYFQTYARAGFNAFRWIPGNSKKFSIYTRDLYQLEKADELLRAAKQQGFHVILALFPANGYQENAPTNPQQEKRLKQRIDEAVNRYGAYVDMWELTNESYAKSVSDAWLRFAAEYLRSIDPYQRLILNSNPRPDDWTYLDARSPHLYDNYLDEKSKIDSITKKFTTGVPVIVTEAGNRGMNWDLLSSARLRMRSWTAFIWGANQIWWNTSHSRECKCNNMYLGAEERSYIRVLQSQASMLQADSQPGVIRDLIYRGTTFVRAYELRSSDRLLVYLFRDPLAGDRITASFQLVSPKPATARWIDPRSGAILGRFAVSEGGQTVTTPFFEDDLLLMIP
ncbi:MAG: cellulase family glycosylhydrolase [Anaerolineales bacterium]|nr:cellulase family glycosylhydrolase [Anaerolineales bacterium]